MTFVSGYRMIFNLPKLEQIYNSILCNTMAKKCIITGCRPTHGTMRKGHKVGIIKAVTVQYICILQVPFPFNVDKLCSDKTKICLDIGPAY